MKYDVITIGGSVEDITFYTNEGVLLDSHKDFLKQKLLAFEYGAKIKIDGVSMSYGGGAANAAVNLARLGFKVAAITALGDDERGRKILGNFKKQKVATNLVKKIKNIETGFSFVLVGQNHEHIVFSDRGANQELRLSASDLKTLKNTNYIYLTSLFGKYWEETLKKALAVKGPKIVWNPGRIQLGNFKKIVNYLPKIDILFLNKDEALELVLAASASSRNFLKVGLDNIQKLLLALKSLGPKAVVITNGQKGADVYDGQKFYHQAILKEQRRVDTTGVGDAFNSSVVAGLELYKGDWHKAMYLGVYNAASLIAQPGAQNGLISKSDLKKIKFNKIK
jgi:sugar/nucleoside kinase (ribokinase family)